jgi:hypothetical protein
MTRRIIDPNRTARLLYERGDAAPPGSAERRALYRLAAAAQRQAEAARELAERISRRRAA